MCVTRIAHLSLKRCLCGNIKQLLRIKLDSTVIQWEVIYDSSCTAVADGYSASILCAIRANT